MFVINMKLIKLLYKSFLQSIHERNKIRLMGMG